MADALDISAKYKEGVEPPFDIWTLKKNGVILTTTIKQEINEEIIGIGKYRTGC